MPKVKGDKKKAKKLKDPNAPKRPLSGYFIWLGEFRNRMKIENPEMVKDVKIFGVAAGEEWKKVSLAERAPYQARSDILKARYEEQMRTYVAPKGFKGSKKVKDPNCPKKPVTAFFLFMADNRERIKAEHPGIRPSQIGKILGEEWKFFDPIRKGEYERIFGANLEQWRKDKAEYDANRPGASSSNQEPVIQHIEQAPVQQVHRVQQVHQVQQIGQVHHVQRGHQVQHVHQVQQGQQQVQQGHQEQQQQQYIYHQY